MLSEVRFEGVHKIFGTETAVEDLNLTVNAGEFLVLVGPTGCGKTTTLRMLAGLERPSYGRILIGDKLVNNVSPRFRDVAMVFQSYALYPHMNVYDNLAFGMRARGAAGSVVAERVKETADVLGLGHLLKRRPSELSGGQRQRVALGRALIRQPQVFLMDEPLSNLDAGFIGSPRMNFVPGRLTTTQGKTAIEFLGVKTPISAGSQLTGETTDGEVTVGLRPEDLMWGRVASPDSTLTVSAEVDVVEPMGHEAYVTAVCAGETVTSRFPPRSGVRTRERVELALNPARLHLFDARSGRTILQRPVAGGADVPRSVGEARVDESEEGRSERQHEPHTRSAQSRAEEIS